MALSGALGCPEDELYFFFIKKEPTIHGATDDEDGRSFTDEEGEHNVENSMLCSFAQHTRSPFLQVFFARGGAVQGCLEVTFFVGSCCTSDRTERKFVATFRVARLTLQTRKLWCRDRGLPGCEEPLKKQKKRK